MSVLYEDFWLSGWPITYQFSLNTATVSTNAQSQRAVGQNQGVAIASLSGRITDVHHTIGVTQAATPSFRRALSVLRAASPSALALMIRNVSHALAITQPVASIYHAAVSRNLPATTTAASGISRAIVHRVSAAISVTGSLSKRVVENLSLLASATSSASVFRLIATVRGTSVQPLANITKMIKAALRSNISAVSALSRLTFMKLSTSVTVDDAIAEVPQHGGGTVFLPLLVYNNSGSMSVKMYHSLIDTIAPQLVLIDGGLFFKNGLFYFEL